MQLLPSLPLLPYLRTSCTSFHYHMITVGAVPPEAPGLMEEDQVIPEPTGAGPSLQLKAVETANHLQGRCSLLK